jgi:hypothetical protein
MSRGPNHLVIKPGSVITLKTISRGASNSRMMNSSCLPGSAFMVVVFLVAMGLMIE